MSSLIVEVCKVKAIKNHPNADRMEIAIVKGWECCVKKDSFKAGDKCIYFPVDTILPESVSDAFNVTKYLSNGRIKAARLRQIPSYGLVMPCTKEVWEAAPNRPEGAYTESVWKIKDNVAEMYGCIKWEPPQGFTQGYMEKEHPLFKKYTDIENIKNFPDVIKEGEEVVLTEKIHGTNSRVGLIDGVWLAGSHNTQRKNPDAINSIKQDIIGFLYNIRRFIRTGKWRNGNSKKAAKNNVYWIPLKNENMKNLISNLGKNNKVVIVFGEIYGKGIQDLTYGKHRDVEYRVFDIYTDRGYLDFTEVENLCNQYSVKMVPVLYRGAWNSNLINEYSNGQSVVSDIEQIREGFVVKPIKERDDPEIGRVILKSVGDDYLLRKGGTEFH